MCGWEGPGTAGVMLPQRFPGVGQLVDARLKGGVISTEPLEQAPGDVEKGMSSPSLSTSSASAPWVPSYFLSSLFHLLAEAGVSSHFLLDLPDGVDHR